MTINQFPRLRIGVVLETLDRDLHRFWEIKEVLQKALKSTSAKSTLESHSRTLGERYIVRLSFKNGSPISIGESRSIAVSSFHCLEQRLIRDRPIIASEYREFLAEYETLGHMTKVH